MKPSPAPDGIGYFVSGTDTGVGKTLISCALIYTLRQAGLNVAGMKPVAAGVDQPGGENEDVIALKAASGLALPAHLINPYLLQAPCAPHLAAAMEGISIDGAHILDCYRQLRTLADTVIVEGVGGFRVPLATGYDSADLAQQLGLPVILVVGMRLGCLSHALLSAEAIAARGLVLAGWVANHITADMPYRADNIASMTRLLPAPLLGCVPYMSTPCAISAAAALDLSALTTHQTFAVMPS